MKNEVTPRLPIWIRNRMTTCPKMLHMDALGNVTKPVTQVAVVAVNSASGYDTEFPFTLLIGSDSSRLPKKIMQRKLSMMIWVVESRDFRCLFITTPANGMMNM